MIRSDFISCSFMILVGGAFRMKDNSDTLPLLANPRLPMRLRHLPVVDVGANDGRDYTLPPALLGHRVYSFEPTPENYGLILKRIARATPNVSHTTELRGFTMERPGTIYLRKGVAVSNQTGTATFYATRKAHGVSNSLNGMKALPRTARRSAVATTVVLTTLSEVLAAEKGVFLLKIDAQGHEYHILQGAKAFIATRPVYYILLEYYPKGLRAGGVDPFDLLTLLQHELGYQCFDLRCSAAAKLKAASDLASTPTAPGRGGPHAAAWNFRDFVRAYPPVTSNEYGTWTDLLCTRFDLL